MILRYFHLPITYILTINIQICSYKLFIEDFKLKIKFFQYTY